MPIKDFEPWVELKLKGIIWETFESSHERRLFRFHNEAITFYPIGNHQIGFFDVDGIGWVTTTPLPQSLKIPNLFSKDAVAFSAELDVTAKVVPNETAMQRLILSPTSQLTILQQMGLTALQSFCRVLEFGELGTKLVPSELMALLRRATDPCSFEVTNLVVRSIKPIDEDLAMVSIEKSRALHRRDAERAKWGFELEMERAGRELTSQRLHGDKLFEAQRMRHELELAEHCAEAEIRVTKIRAAADVEIAKQKAKAESEIAEQKAEADIEIVKKKTAATQLLRIEEEKALKAKKELADSKAGILVLFPDQVFALKMAEVQARNKYLGDFDKEVLRQAVRGAEVSGELAMLRQVAGKMFGVSITEARDPADIEGPKSLDNTLSRVAPDSRDSSKRETSPNSSDSTTEND